MKVVLYLCQKHRSELKTPGFETQHSNSDDLCSVANCPTRLARWTREVEIA